MPIGNVDEKENSFLVFSFEDGQYPRITYAVNPAY
jgi:hypothetical protein